MKKILLSFVALFAMVSMATAQRAWAYDLELTPSGDSYTFAFKAVTAGDATLVFYKEGVEAGTLDLGSVSAGDNTVTKTSEELLGAIQQSGDFNWGVKMSAGAIASFVELTEDSNTDFHFWMPTGVAVDNNPESPYFGQFYIASPRSGKMTEGGGSGIQHNAGVYVFDQTLKLLNETKQQGYLPSNVKSYVSGSNHMELHRIAVNPITHKVAFTHQSTSVTAAVWNMDPADMKATATNLIDGTAITKSNSLCFDENGVLYVVNSTDKKVYTVKDGVVNTFGTSAEFIQDRNAIVTDGRGGLWIAQYRAQDIAQDGYARLMHFNAEGILDYKVDKDTPHDFTGTAQRGAVAYNTKEDVLAFGANRYGNLYKVTYNAETGVPSLESIGKTPSIAANIDGLAFDYAGDLYVTSASVERLFKYEVPTTNNTCTTPAKKSQVITLVSATPEHTVTINVNGNGTVTGANTGTYLEGTELTLTATPAEHYEFTGWTGDVTSTENPLTITVDGNKTITANFQEHDKYTITAVANDENMGTVTGGDTYYAGESATLKATAKSGYVFAGWADGEKNATRTVTVSGDATYTANFQVIAPRAWAYDLKVVEDGDNYKFTFNTTAAGSATLLFADIDGNELVAPYAVGTVAAGANTVTLPQSTFATVTKDVYWSVKMDGEAIPAISEITDASKGIYNFYLPQGVAVDNNPESSTFSKIYIAESTDGASDGGSDRADNQKRGIFIYDQTLAELNPTNKGIIPSNVTLTNTTRNALKRIAINPKTNEVAFAYNASPAAVWAVSTENVAGEATNLLAGLGFDYCNSLCFDENGILYIFDNGAGYPAKGSLYKIVNGEKHTIFSENSKYGNADNSLASDGRGGLWIYQNRGQLDNFNQLSHINANGEIDFEVNSTTPHDFASLNTSRGAMAYNPREDILAIGIGASGAIGVSLYQVTYDPSTDVPSLEYIGATPSLGKNVEGIAFDYAGDLYALSANTERFYKFTLPTPENICTVPAPSSQKLVLGTQCEVKVAVNDPAMGSVEGAGQYEKGTEVTLTPNPVAHHRFVNWTGDITSTDNPLKFTIEGDVNLTANFEAIPQVTIIVTSNNEDMGTVTGGGTYDEGQEVTIAANPKATYRFVKWSDDVTDATRTFPAAEDLTLQAIFEKVPNRAWAYDLSQVADGDNYKFSFVATTAGEATLLFADKDGNELVVPHVVGAVNAGANTVTLPQSIFAGVTKDVYWSVKMDGEEITAVAEITDQAKGIYDFVDMTGVLVDNNPDSKYFGEVYVQMALNGTVGSKTQTAGLFIFDQTLAIKNTDANAGIQPILPSEYTMGDNRNKFHRLEIDPKTGNLTYCYNVADDPAIFVIDRENMAGNATNILEGVAGLTRTAAHCYDAEGTLYVMDIAASKGTIYKIVDGQAIQLTEPNAKWVNASISLAADGNGGLWVSHNRGQMDTYYQLVHVTAAGELDYTVWQDNTNGFEGGCNRGALAYDAERQILAQGRNGKVELYSVAFDATTGVPTLTNIAITPFTANNIDGLAFDYAGDLYVVNTGTKKFYKYTIPTAENICTVPAPSSQKLVLGTQCEVTVTVNDPAMGSVEGAGIYEKGTEVILTPNPVAHHRFVNWTGDMTSTDNPLKFTIEGDVTLTANFEAIPTYTITTSVNESDMGSVTAGGTYYEDTEVTLTATANAGYVFVQWSDGVTEETRTITATENVNLEAIFAKASPRAWAYDLRLDAVADPANYTFTFTATSAGTATIFFTDEEGTPVAPTQEVVGTVAAGETKTVTIAKSAFTGDKDIYWSVKVEGEAIAKMAELTDPTKGIYSFYLPQGVAVDNNTDSEYFGRIYLAEATDGATDGQSDRTKAQKRGIFIFDQKLADLNPAANVGILPANAATAMTDKTRQAIHRVAVNPTNGQVAFAYNVSGSSAVWSMNPANLSGNAINLIDNSITAANSICFDKDGALYVMDNANAGSIGGQIYKEDENGKLNLFAAHNKDFQWANADNALAPDGRGGLWIAQNRWAYDYPILSHVSKDGVVDFAVKENLNGWFPSNYNSSYRGQLAYNEKEDVLAFGGNKVAALFKVTYDANGKPTITEKLMTTPELGTNIDGLAFDYAGDLYVASATAERFYKFVVPTTDNTCTVPAPESQIIMKEPRYTVTVEANDNALGTVSGGGEYKAGKIAKLTATANTGYRFVNWTKVAEEVSISASFEYTVPAEDVTLTANFAPLPAITYELNDGVWNKYGWTSKKDMYYALLDDWRAYSGESRQNTATYEQQLGIGNSSKGIPTTIYTTEGREQLLALLLTDATYAPKWGWLATYVDAVAAAQSKTTQPTTAAGNLTYTIGNFFGEDNMHANDWMGAVDFTGEEAHITEFAPYWGQTFPMPTQPTEEIVLNAPYKEGYLFEGWYAAPDFSGAEVTTVDENTNGTLYAKWLEHRYTRSVTSGDFGTICLPYGSNNYSGAEFYEIAYLQLKDDGVTPMGIWLDEAPFELVAGKPYIFKATSNLLTVNYKGEEALSPVEGKAGLTGTFDGITDETVLQGNYMIADNKFWLCGTGCWLNANRAYIDKNTLHNNTTPVAAIPGRRRVMMGAAGENTTTGVDNLTEDGVVSTNQATKMVVNGQLIIIRDGVKYNAQGVRL